MTSASAWAFARERRRPPLRPRRRGREDSASSSPSSSSSLVGLLDRRGSTRLLAASARRASALAGLAAPRRGACGGLGASSSAGPRRGLDGLVGRGGLARRSARALARAALAGARRGRLAAASSADGARPPRRSVARRSRARPRVGAARAASARPRPRARDSASPRRRRRRRLRSRRRRVVVSASRPEPAPAAPAALARRGARGLVGVVDRGRARCRPRPASRRPASRGLVLALAALRRALLGGGRAARGAAAPSRAPRRARAAASSAASASAPTSTARGDRAARLLDPDELLLAHERDAVDDVDQVAVDLGDRVVLVVHVRLDEVDVDLLARPERHRVLLDLRARALHRHREVVQRQAVGALEVEVAAGLGLERVQLARAVGDEPGRDLRVDPQQVGLGPVRRRPR